MTIRFATPLLVAGVLALSACGSSSTSGAITTLPSSGGSASPSDSVIPTTASTLGNTLDSTAEATSTVPDSASMVEVKAVEGVVWNKKTYTATAKNGKVTITGINSSSIAHNLYVVDSTGTVIGDFINLPTKGSNDTRVLPLSPGTYRIVCKVPGHSNMNSGLVVS